MKLSSCRNDSHCRFLWWERVFRRNERDGGAAPTGFLEAVYWFQRLRIRQETTCHHAVGVTMARVGYGPSRKTS